MAVCSSSVAKVNAFRKQFRSQFQATELLAETCDAADRTDIRRFCARIRKTWSHLDVLVNNAGIFEDGAILSSREGAFEKMMNTNLSSAYHFTRELFPLLKRSDKGHVLNMCSTASLEAYPNGALYGITKVALLGFSKALRLEMMPHKIAVTAVMPGPVFTDSWAGSGISEKRFMQPEDVANLIFDIYKMPKRAVVEEVLIRPMGGDV